MDELIYQLIHNIENRRECELILESFRTTPWLYGDYRLVKPPTLLSYILQPEKANLFRRLFHLHRRTLDALEKEVTTTKAFKLSILTDLSPSEVTIFLCAVILYTNTNFSIRCCSRFCGIPVANLYTYISLFNKIMNELKDKVIRFPALSNQNLLRVNSKRFFPGAVGVVGRSSSLRVIIRCPVYSESGVYTRELVLFCGTSMQRY